MAIKKYRVEVVRTDEYEIEIDDAIYTDEFIEQWSESFQDTDEESRTEDFVKHLAGSITCNGKAQGLEGFGYIKQSIHSCDGELELSQYSSGLKRIPEEEFSPGIKVEIINYDEDYEIEIFENN